MHWKASLYFVIIQGTFAHAGGAVASTIPEGISVSYTDPKRTLLLRVLHFDVLVFVYLCCLFCIKTKHAYSYQRLY